MSLNYTKELISTMCERLAALANDSVDQALKDGDALTANHLVDLRLICDAYADEFRITEKDLAK